MSPREVEETCAQWMRYLGIRDAATNSYVKDGGIDIVSSGHIAQVKHFQAPVGIGPVREFAGVALVDGRIPFFFSTSGYTSGAVQFANETRIALFRLDLDQGRLFAMSRQGERVTAGR